MSNRMVRVNSLVHREISHIIHTEFQVEAVSITITEVNIAPDLRNGRVFYSVLGGPEQIKEARKFFKRFAGRIKFLMGNAIILKYTPDLTYHYDDSFARGTELLQFMEKVDPAVDPTDREGHE